MGIISTQIDTDDGAIVIPINRTGRTDDLQHRFVLQWLHPNEIDKNPTMSFTISEADVDTSNRSVSAATITNTLKNGNLLFLNIAYSQPFRECKTLQIHQYLDFHRDWVQRALGVAVESVPNLIFGQIKIGPFTLDKIINPSTSLKLSDEWYSLSTGFAEININPIPDGSINKITASLQANKDVRCLVQQNQHAPSYMTIVNKGEITSEIHINYCASNS